jgi:hypothetical protein
MPAEDVAATIVAYDRGIAFDLLRQIARDLGGPADADAPRLHAYLSRHDAVDDPAKTTSEWKVGFAHQERLRALGLALAELLR